MFGTLDMVDDGRLSLMGRTFRLSEARVAFTGDGDPDVLIIGETRVGDYQVTLRAGGPVSDMEASYSSDPPLSERDLKSLLVTGRTADISGTGSADDEMFVLGTASSDILGVAGQMVGLDSVQLGRGDFELGSSDVNPAMRLTVSRTLNDRSRLVLSQDLDNNKLTWILVFVPRRGFEVRLSQRDNLEEVIEFRQEIGFGAGTSPPVRPDTGRRRRGPRVASLEFTGSPGRPASELEEVVKLRPSRTFDVRTWQLDRERLEAFYRDRGFAVARIVPRRTVTSGADGERVHLEYRIDPGPRTLLIVNGIDVSGAERDGLMRTWSQAVLIEFLEEDLTRSLRGLLASRNQLRPSIDVKVDAPNAQVVRAQVTIDPGPVTRVRRVVFEGRSAISDAELRAGLEARVDMNAAWVDPGPLTLAVESIYAERGLPKARAEAQPLRFDGDAAELRVRITEGPAAVVEDIITTGVAEARVEGATSAIGLQRGQPVLLSTERDARRRLERFYLDLGFRSARVQSAQTQDPDGRITLRFSVAEGPLSVVTDIEVRGLEATRPAAAHRAIMLQPGQPAAQQAVADTQRRLYGMGVFRRAEVGFEPADGPPAADAATTPVRMTVDVAESRRFRLRYGVQLSNQFGPVLEDFTSAVGAAADIRDTNFLGRGFALGASTRIEKNLQSVRGQFSLPLLLNQRLRTSLFGTLRAETDTSDTSVTYTDKERDVSFEQRLALPRQMEVSWGTTTTCATWRSSTRFSWSHRG